MGSFRIEDFGFHRPRATLTTSVDEAVEAANEIGFPIVLKVVSNDVFHKTDVGGIRLNLHTPDAVVYAYEEMLRTIREKAPHAKVDGILVEEMCSGGHEIVIGLLTDPQFGPTIMFGLGGIFVEVLEDVSFRTLPIDRSDAFQMIHEVKSHVILEGYRNLPEVSQELLIDLLLKAGNMGTQLASRLEAVDLNPIMVWESEHRVLDAKVLLNEAAPPELGASPNTSWLDRFFKAASIAVVGASATEGKIGHSVLDSLVNHEYEGRIFPINPTRKKIMGLDVFPSIPSLPESPDLVVITVSLSDTPRILEECADMGVHNVIIVSGGGKELGGKQKALEENIRSLAHERELRIVGPNCIGVFDGDSRLDTFFQVYERMVRPPKGPLSVFTQSGTVGVALLEQAQSTGVSRFVSFGNRVDVDESDLLAYAANDDDTQVIACYVEGFRDGKKFVQAAKQVTAKKPVLLFKGGRSERGARASVSHTGFFGGSHALCQGAMKQAGVTLFDSIEELSAAAKALVMQPRAAGNRIAMISNGAGTMVQGIDLIQEMGLAMEALSADTITNLERVYPPYFIIQNPIDVTGSATSKHYRQGIEALLKEPNVDIVMPWFVFQDTPLDEAIVEVLHELQKSPTKPILCGAVGGPYTSKMSAAIEEIGIPVFHTVREWMAAARGAAGAHT